MKTFCLSLAVLLALTAFFGMVPAKAEVVDRIVAIVNDDIITLRDVQRFVEVKTKGRFLSVNDYFLGLQLKDKLDVMIETMLISQQAAKMKIEVGEREVEAVIENIRRQNLVTDAQFREQLKSEGVNYKDFAEGIRKSLLRNRVLARAVAPDLFLDDAKLKDFYQQHLDDYRESEFRLRHILVSGQRSDAASRAQQVYKLLEEGRSFESVAKEYSDDPSAAQGGDIGLVRTSATTGAGLDELLERLALEAEALELKANHFAKASGAVLEAKLREGQGVVATLLVQRGSLAIGDVVLAGPAYGKVRSLVNWKGERSELAGPSTAVEVIGLDDLPRAGDVFTVCDDLRQAAEAAEARRDKLREKALAARQKTVTTATVFGDLAAAKRKEVKVVVKADAAGSLEVLQKTIAELGTDEVRAAVIHSGIGAINASDVQLADASQAVVIGFHVIADAKARALADQTGVDIRSYTIIYEMLDELKLAMSGQLEPESRETIIGHAEVRQTFTITRVGVVAGLFITDGFARRDAWMRITRDGTINHVGKVGSLRRFKEDVKEVKADYECGLTVEGFQDIKVGDVMEFYLKERVTRSL